MPASQPAAEGSSAPKIASGGWGSSAKAKEFIPKGTVVKTEDQFMGLDALDEEAPKKKKGGKKGKVGQKVAVPEPVSKEEEAQNALDESLPWKGKSSDFFLMVPTGGDNPDPSQLELTEEQWNFIFKYYPEHAGAPQAMITWLYGEAWAYEQQMAEQQAMYAKPEMGGVNAGGD